MPAPRRAARRTGRRTARRTSRRMAAATSYDEPQQTYEPAPAPPQEQPAEPAPTDPDDALVQRLEELSELHDQGVLTDAQFEEAKNRIIN